MRTIFVNYIHKDENGNLINTSKILSFEGKLNSETIDDIYEFLREGDDEDIVITFFHILEE